MATEPEQPTTEVQNFFPASKTQETCLYLGVVTKNEKRRIIVLLTYPKRNLQRIRFSHYVDMANVKIKDFDYGCTDEEYEAEFWRSLECKRDSFDYKVRKKDGEMEYLYLIKKSQRGKRMIYAKIEILSPEHCDGTNYILTKLEPTIKTKNNLITTLRKDIIIFTRESHESLVEYRKLIEKERIEDEDLINRFILVLKQKNKRMNKLKKKLQNMESGGAKKSRIKNPHEILNEEEDDEKQAEVDDDEEDDENKDFEENILLDLKIPSMQEIEEELKKEDLMKANLAHRISYNLLPTVPSMDPDLDKVFDSFSGNFNDDFQVQRKRRKKIIKRRFNETDPEQAVSQKAKKQKISAEDIDNEDPLATLPNIYRKTSDSQSSDADDLYDALI